MPLHDWTERSGWEGMHHIWITELLRWVKPRLPDHYRAYIGSMPTIAIGAPSERPDIAVRTWQASPTQNDATPATSDSTMEAEEEIAVASLEPSRALYIEVSGQLVAALELISPRNKDRPSSRATYLSRYVGYLQGGVHLLIVDVHRRPLKFSFADAIASELNFQQPACPAPCAVSYRVGDPAATGGRMLRIRRQPLAVGDPLSTVVLPIRADASVSVDLDATYRCAAADAYLT